MAEVRGVCDRRFGAVRDALAELLDADDVGASAAVYLDGEPVADIWGGYADAARTIAWERDTITNVWSTTKTMVALCALLLADRGDLDLTAPVARYWPEFAAAGKEGVRIAHVLAHTAGLPDFDGPVTAADLYDWPAVTTRLAGPGRPDDGRLRDEPDARPGSGRLPGPRDRGGCLRGPGVAAPVTGAGDGEIPRLGFATVSGMVRGLGREHDPVGGALAGLLFERWLTDGRPGSGRQPRRAPRP